MSILYQSTKTYAHSVGLSCAFRQWKAESHCRFIHGYALQVKLVFEAKVLDDTNWVVDFGSLKPVKKWLEDSFDHKLLVAFDDPHKVALTALANDGIASVRIVNNTGCEAFAKEIYMHVERWLVTSGYAPRCRLSSVEVSEHEGNSAVVRSV